MGLSNYYLTVIMVVYISCPLCCVTARRTAEDRALAKLLRKCEERCGGHERFFYQDESWICCGPEPEKDRNYSSFSMNCLRECTGDPLCDNTLECKCESCKQTKGPGRNVHRGFCSERHEYHVLKKDCEELVCTGKVPWRGRRHCKENPDEPE